MNKLKTALAKVYMLSALPPIKSNSWQQKIQKELLKLQFQLVYSTLYY